MSAILDALLGVVGTAGAILDTPGSIIRNSLAGENPFKGLFNPEERTYGNDLLEGWGLRENDPDKWFEPGDFAGFGMELVTDPLNALGLGLATKAARGAKAARVGNEASEALRASGAIPEEVLALSKVKEPVFHGTTTRNLLPWELDPNLVGKNTKDGGWFGSGTYWSPDEQFAQTFSLPVGNAAGTSKEAASANRLRELFELDPDFPIEIIQHQAPFFDKEAARAARQSLKEARTQGTAQAQQAASEAMDFNAAVGNAIGAGGSRMGGSIGVPPGKNIGAYLDVRNPAYVKYADPHFTDEFGNAITGPQGPLEVPREASKFYEPFSNEIKSNTASRDATESLKELGYDGVIAQGEFPEIATFSQSQAYLPFVAPALREVPKMPSKLLATLLAYNAAQTAGGY
jgi:hypothetical protein